MTVFPSRVGFVGSATVDLFVDSPGSRNGGSKQDCRFQVQLGGGAVNGARQAQQLSIDTALVAFTGWDDASCIASRGIRRNFPNSIIIPALAESRISVLTDGKCLTSRPAIAIEQLPTEALDLLSTCNVVVVAPATPNDTDFLLNMIQALPAECHTMLQLSMAQLNDPQNSGRLMDAVDIVLLNEAEACAFANTPYPNSAIRAIQECGARNLVVTSTTGVWAHLDGAEYSQDAYRVDHVKMTVGAGDVFAGTFATALALQKSWKSSLMLALGAAALHVTGRSMPTCPDRIVDKLPMHEPTKEFAQHSISAPVPSPITVKDATPQPC